MQSGLHQLDGKRIQGAWQRPLAKVLQHLVGRCDSVDLAVLRELAGYARRNQHELRQLATGSGLPPKTPGIHDQFPVAATLLALARSGHESPGLDLLASILINASLEQRYSKLVVRLGEMIRGACEDINNPLRLIIANAANVLELVSRVDDRLANHAAGLHPGFEGLWRRELGNTLGRWIRDDPARMLRALQPPSLAPTIDGPELELPRDAIDADDDDAPTLDSLLTDGRYSSDEPISPRAEVSRAKSRFLLRRSEGNVDSSADSWVPDEIAGQVARSAVEVAQRLQASGQRIESERYVALALAMATGLREMDLEEVVWADQESAETAIDLSAPIFWKPVVRPVGALHPPDSMRANLENAADRISWPLPASVHDLLLGLVERSPISGSLVLPHQSGIGSRSLASSVGELLPGLALGSGVLRLNMAAHISARLGADVAQLAMGDSFSMSTAPARYCGCPVSKLVSTITNLQYQRFGATRAVQVPSKETYLGSRLVLTDSAARHWSAQLLKSRRSVAHRKDADVSEGWVAHRNFLAAALCAVTGHRPTHQVGQIDLDSVIPEYGLILLSDKMCDPLRKYRIACTGRRWMQELREFLDRLVSINRGHPDAAAGRLAGAILRNELPLFTVPGPDGNRSYLDAAELRSTMPAELVDTPNHYRHRLNQYLQRVDVDPELRHAQLGWVMSPVYATADLSPLSAVDLSRRLGDVLDGFLVHDGWFGASQRVSPWSWRDVPARPWRDWQQVAEQHFAEHADAAKRIRQERAERGREMEVQVLPRLEQAFREFCPGLRLDGATRRLRRIDGLDAGTAVDIDANVCELILQRVRQGDTAPESALEQATAAILLHRLLTRSHRDGLTRGALPRRPLFGATAEPSPFLSGIGLAVRHAEVIRSQVREGAERWAAHDRGVLATLAILCFSGYRNLGVATAAVGAASAFQRANEPGDWIRIPVTLDGKATQIILGGLPALLIAKRAADAPTGRAPSREKIVSWLQRRVPASAGLDAEQVLARAAQTLAAAGRVELSGPERMLLLGRAVQSTVSVERCLGNDDRWPVRTCETEEAISRDVFAQVHESAPIQKKEAPAPVESIAGYRDLVEMLDPDGLRRRTGKRSDTRHAWRSDLAREFEKLIRAVGTETNIGLLVGFCANRLRHGGAKKKRLAQRTLHSELTRFGRALLEVLESRDLLNMSAETRLEVYTALLVGKPRTARPQAMEALRMFQWYLEQVHRVDPMSFADLELLAGPRTVQTDAGLLTDAEIDAALDVLHSETELSHGSIAAAPEATRLASLRFLMALLLDASGARPGSVYGLQVQDIHLLGTGRDFIHIHATGGFGEAKSRTAIGFAPLEGARWAKYRGWVIAWLAKEHTASCNAAPGKAPLFAFEPGKLRRFDREFLTERLARLLRWSSNEPDARPYWLRKSRVMARHRELAKQGKTARDAWAALGACGHATMATPVAHYISDPAIVFARSLHDETAAPRADLMRVAHVADPHLVDMRLYRSRKKGSTRITSAILDDLNVPAAERPEGRRNDPPILVSGKSILPKDVDRFAREMQASGSPVEAMVRAGLSGVQVKILQRAVARLAGHRGKVPWKFAALKHGRSVMAAPRRLKGADRIMDLLENAPDASLSRLASAWASRGHPSRLVDATSHYLLVDEEEVLAAENVFAAIGLPAVVDAHGEGIFALSIPTRETKSDSRKGRQYSLIAALDWVFVIVWLHEQLAEAEKRAKAVPSPGIQRPANPAAV